MYCFVKFIKLTMFQKFRYYYIIMDFKNCKLMDLLKYFKDGAH